MKSTKTNKGITLIALIITIVVLLILAVVAINSIQNEGILAHAGNATGTYNNAVVNEQGILDEYEEFFDPESCVRKGHILIEKNYTNINAEKHKVTGTCEICEKEVSIEESHNFKVDSMGYCACGKMCPTCEAGNFNYRYEPYETGMHNVHFNCPSCTSGDSYGEECKWSEGETCDEQECIYCKQQRQHYFENGKCTACNTEHTCSGEKGYDTSMTSGSYYHVCNECGNKEACDPDWENSPYEYGANCKICGGYNP